MGGEIFQMDEDEEYKRSFDTKKIVVWIGNSSEELDIFIDKMFTFGWEWTATVHNTPLVWRPAYVDEERNFDITMDPHLTKILSFKERHIDTNNLRIPDGFQQLLNSHPYDLTVIDNS